MPRVPELDEANTFMTLALDRRTGTPASRLQYPSPIRFCSSILSVPLESREGRMGQSKKCQKILAIVLGFVASSPARGNGFLEDRVKLEYPDALTRLEARYESMHGRVICQDHHAPANGTPSDRTFQIDFAVRPGAMRTEITRDDERPREGGGGAVPYQSVRAVNATYGFWLERQRKGDAFALRHLYDDPKQALERLEDAHARSLRCATTFGTKKLASYINSKSCQVTSVEKSESNLVIKLIHVPEVRRTDPGFTDIDGWLVVSPDDGWILREYGFVRTIHGRNNTVKTNTNIAKIEYARSESGQFDPVKFRLREVGRRIDWDKDLDIHSLKSGFDMSFDKVQFEALPESEFRLPAFGMPEVDPAGKEGAAADRPYGMFAMAGVGFALAGGLRYAARRKSA